MIDLLNRGLSPDGDARLPRPPPKTDARSARSFAHTKFEPLLASPSRGPALAREQDRPRFARQSNAGTLRRRRTDHGNECETPLDRATRGNRPRVASDGRTCARREQRPERCSCLHRQRQQGRPHRRRERRVHRLAAPGGRDAGALGHSGPCWHQRHQWHERRQRHERDQRQQWERRQRRDERNRRRERDVRRLFLGQPPGLPERWRHLRGRRP